MSGTQREFTSESSCPHCGTTRIRSSRMRISDIANLALLRLPVRCCSCLERFHLSIGHARRLSHAHQVQEMREAAVPKQPFILKLPSAPPAVYSTVGSSVNPNQYRKTVPLGKLRQRKSPSDIWPEQCVVAGAPSQPPAAHTGRIARMPSTLPTSLDSQLELSLSRIEGRMYAHSVEE